MRPRSIEQLNQIVGNNRTVMANVRNGIKAWETRKKLLLENAINNGVKPDKLFSEYWDAKLALDNDYSKEGIIAKHVYKVRRGCFIRWGDKNHIDRIMSANWFSSQAQPMDCIAQELTEMYNIPIDENDIVEFIIQHPDRDMYKPIVKYNTTIAIFKYRVGFHPKNYKNNSPEFILQGLPF